MSLLARVPRPEPVGLQPDDRELAGRIAALLYLTGAASALGLLALPGVDRSHWLLMALIAAAGAAWGLACWLLVPWRRAPGWVTHLSTAMGLPITVVATAATGGASSPARFYLLFVVVFAAYFYPTRAAWAYALACVLAHAVPLLYEHDDEAGDLLAECVVLAPTYLVLAGAIGEGKRLLLRLRARAERLAAEQGALRRVATAVAAHGAPEGVYALVAEELAGLLDAAGAGVLRLESKREATLVGTWSAHPERRFPVGGSIALEDGSGMRELIRTGESVRVVHAPDDPIAQLGYACSMLAPVRVDGRTWGALAVAAAELDALDEEAGGRLAAFADLLATAIANTEDRAKLAAQAFTDPLTGLGNHRAFHERLAEEVARARRHGRALALALVDVDHFKRSNDAYGHEEGDRRLTEVAAALRAAARADDVLARIGGDEFAWLLPEVDRHEGYVAVERARRRLGDGATRGLTISAGVCDLELAVDGEELLRLADGALYWSKSRGRDTTWIYEPGVVRELSSHERAEHLERTQALLGLRALARVIDAKDQATRRHSERVADLAGRLAVAAGWAPERVELLREAALVHDVGKIGIPDAVLLKSGPLAPDEIAAVREHAPLGAKIVQDVLSDEQVAWVRAHHERFDGGGYPAGLGGEEIPDGAALLAIADAWDAMTASGGWGSSLPLAPDRALRECAKREGTEFAPAAVAALRAVAASDALAGGPVVPAAR